MRRSVKKCLWAVFVLGQGPAAGCYVGLDVAANGIAEETAGTDGPQDDAGGSDGSDGSGGDTSEGEDSSEVSISPTTRVSRLSTQEYTNTVRDLFRDPDLAAPILTETADGRLDQGLTSDYRRAAETYAASVAHEPESLARILDCDPSDECARKFIAEFGLRAYRRPLTADEQGRYEGLYASREEFSEDGSFESGVELLLTAMLQSPFFLHRVELSDELADNGLITVDDFEMASRLSYLLWHTMPDDALLSAAAGGQLHTDTQIGTTVDRLLADPRADEVIIAFHERWLGAEQIQSVFTGDDAMTDITESLRSSMRGFLEYVLLERGGSPQELLTSPRVFADETLASLYDVDVDPDSASLDMPAERFGLMTQPFVLAVNTNPVHRGLFIHDALLCTTFPPPPELTPEQEGLIEDTNEPGTTRRQRIEAGFENPECAGCHSMINPPGFSLEHYDRLGRFRELDNGLPVDASGSMMVYGEMVNFEDAGMLAATIADSEGFRACYAKHWAQYLFGEEDPSESMTAPLVEEIGRDDYRVEDLLHAAALSDAVRYRSSEDWVAD